MKNDTDGRCRIILASASPRRAELLNLVGLDFIIMPSDDEEESTDLLLKNMASQSKVAEYLAEKKALSIAEKLQLCSVDDSQEEAVIIGADTIVSIDGKILGKPADKEDAIKMLETLNGRWHEVYTGLSVIKKAMKSEVRIIEMHTSSEKTRVKFANLTNKTMERYVATEEPMDKAGAYGIQGIGALIVERIEGCYFNVMGLPLFRLSVMLKEIGLELL